jgi:small subunit ribosomal protein S6
MAAPAPKYDLMLLTDAKADEAARDKIRADVRAMIEKSGTLLSSTGYGTRKLAFEIAKEPEAEYDLLQFEGPSSLLDELNRTLRITDGVARFRIIKVRPGTPDPPDLRQAADPEAPAEPVAAL